MVAPAENLKVRLSREELLFLLFTLKTDFIPGLDADPVGELSQEQKNLGLVYAERALRARDLVAVNENGALVVREALLLMIGTCAYSPMMITLHHFSTYDVPKQMFWHIRNGVTVAHTRPDAPLHDFAFVPNRETLVQQIIDECTILIIEKNNYPEIATTNAILKTVREQATKNLEEFIQTLVSQAVPTEAAKEICSILAGKHYVSALHLAVRQEDKTLLQEVYNSRWDYFHLAYDPH